MLAAPAWIMITVWNEYLALSHLTMCYQDYGTIQRNFGILCVEMVSKYFFVSY